MIVQWSCHAIRSKRQRCYGFAWIVGRVRLRDHHTTQLRHGSKWVLIGERRKRHDRNSGKDENYFKIAVERIRRELAQGRMF